VRDEPIGIDGERARRLHGIGELEAKGCTQPGGVGGDVRALCDNLPRFHGENFDDARETQYLVAFGSKHDMRAIPLEQRHAQILLELAHLDTEGWLGNGAAIGCPHPRRMRSQP
jgi:hypothetical protein